MNSFQRLLKTNNVSFGEINNYFFITKFQSTHLAHDHGLLWSKNALKSGISIDEKMKNLLINI
jgi:hypothetical protein